MSALRRRKSTRYGRNASRMSPASALVRIDQIFLAGGAFGVDGDVIELQRLLQRHHLGVMAGKGGLELGDDARPQFCALDLADLHQERKQQPAADPPGHAERAVELGRAKVEAAIDVDLL